MRQAVKRTMSITINQTQVHAHAKSSSVHNPSDGNSQSFTVGLAVVVGRHSAPSCLRTTERRNSGSHHTEHMGLEHLGRSAEPRRLAEAYQAFETWVWLIAALAVLELDVVAGIHHRSHHVVLDPFHDHVVALQCQHWSIIALHRRNLPQCRPSHR